MIIFILETTVGAYLYLSTPLFVKISVIVFLIVWAIFFIPFVAGWVARVYETDKIRGMILCLLISGIFIVLDLIGFILYSTYNTIGAINSMFHYIYPVYK
jgi:hypothetical protein